MLALTVLAIVATIIAFAALDFWWKADRFLCDERARRRKLAQQLEALPGVLPLCTAAEAAAAMVVRDARLNPGAEILCAVDGPADHDDRMSDVIELLRPDDLAVVIGRPGEIRLANGSRILFRMDRPGSFRGIYVQSIYWFGNGSIPDNLASCLRARSDASPRRRKALQRT